MNSKAVIGLGFGDEGKGLVTNYLCLQNPEALVVRYSGGQQAGHTVVKDDKRHVFSNFGSGTLNGNPTYWSQYCSVDPIGIYNELQTLLRINIKPNLYIYLKCPVTTPYEKHSLGRSITDGTCGTGVGQTFQREENHYSLLFEDLFIPTILEIKLDLIKEYYKDICGLISQEEIDVFLYCVNKVINSKYIHLSFNIPKDQDIIFEGSQGLLLDQNIGFFPHVTRSNTGSKNILELNTYPYGTSELEYFMVTRAYQTRHGNGPMTHFEDFCHIIANPLETNVSNKFQGDFRVSLLDLDLLEYGMKKDGMVYKNKIESLVITCLDQLEDYYFVYKGKVVKCFDEKDFIEKVSQILGFINVYISKSDKSENIIKVI